MAKKQFFAILDTETTMGDTVADFGIVICDRNGKIHHQCAVMVNGHFGTAELFHDKNANDIWGYAGLEKRKAKYNEMIANGQRMIASVNAINKWIALAVGKYDPILTAYNLAFDLDKCEKTGIDLSVFTNKFCLWQAALGNICNAKKYKQFAIENHAINNRTKFGNMTIKTNAEIVCGFVSGNIIDEPHTALEDARDFELPILVNVLKKKAWRDNIISYDWHKWQLKDHSTAK